MSIQRSWPISLKAIVFGVAGVCVLAIGVHFAMAATGAAGTAFQPMTYGGVGGGGGQFGGAGGRPGDAFIQHTGYAVYNTDTASAQDITASAGLPGICIDCGPTDYTFHAAVYDNGGKITCTAYVIELGGSFPTHVGAPQSVTTVGAATLTFDVSFTATAGIVYAPSIVCTLPRSDGANGNATLIRGLRALGGNPGGRPAARDGGRRPCGGVRPATSARLTFCRRAAIRILLRRHPILQLSTSIRTSLSRLWSRAQPAAAAARAGWARLRGRADAFAAELRAHPRLMRAAAITLDVLALAVTATVFLQMNKRFFYSPIGYDEEFFAWGGWSITKGLAPYRDFIEFKPPMVFITHAFAQLLFGFKNGGYRKFFTIFPLLSMLVLQGTLMARRIPRLLVAGADDRLHRPLREPDLARHRAQ